jgi:hypothetical protein
MLLVECLLSVLYSSIQLRPRGGLLTGGEVASAQQLKLEG